MDFTHADRWRSDIFGGEVPTFSHTFEVQDFFYIHQFNEPASGTCNLIIAFESDRTNADFRRNSLFFEYLC